METEVEGTIWKGRPSQILNAKTFLICGLLIAGTIAASIYWQIPLLALLILIPLGWAFWKFLALRCRVFELTSERLRLFEGVLNQDIAEVELYRVKDTNITRPFWLRVFGLSTIKLDTSDRTMPVVNLTAIKNGLHVRELLRKQVELLRDRKRVREIDFDGTDDDGLELDEM